MALAATQVFSFTVTIPAQTDITAPVTTDVSFPAASVVSIRWRVPPGPSGFMGWSLTSDGGAVIPAQAGQYIVADNEFAQWDVQGYQDSGSWQVTGYNTDGYDHSVYLDFMCVAPGMDNPGAASPPPPPVSTDNSSLSTPPPDATTFIPGLQVPI